MKEILEKIRVDGCAGLKCTRCPLYCFCREEGHPISTELIKWAAKGMLYEMEQNSRKIFDWLYELQTETNEEIRVFFEHPDYIEGFPITLVNASDNILYFDINGADVRVESHECSEDFGVEQLRLTDILGIEYTVELDNPIRGGQMSKLQEIKNTIMITQPSERINITFENENNGETVAGCGYFSGNLVVYDYDNRVIIVYDDDTTFYLDGAEYTIKDAVELSYCKRHYLRLK